MLDCQWLCVNYTTGNDGMWVFEKHILTPDNITPEMVKDGEIDPIHLSSLPIKSNVKIVKVYLAPGYKPRGFSIADG